MGAGETMTDEFMRRLALAVAHFLPVTDGESLEDYCARARQEPVIARRALIAAALTDVSGTFYVERQARKAAWIAAARLAFAPGKRQACACCHKYEGLTEAHHVVPLSVQFDAGAVEPLLDYEWLCPTHHAAQHILINGILANVTKSIAGLPPGEADALDRLNVRFVELATKLPDWLKSRRP